MLSAYEADASVLDVWLSRYAGKAHKGDRCSAVGDA